MTRAERRGSWFLRAPEVSLGASMSACPAQTRGRRALSENQAVASVLPMCPASGLWGVLVPPWWLAVVYLTRNSELGNEIVDALSIPFHRETDSTDGHLPLNPIS